MKDTIFFFVPGFFPPLFFGNFLNFAIYSLLFHSALQNEKTNDGNCIVEEKSRTDGGSYFVSHTLLFDVNLFSFFSAKCVHLLLWHPIFLFSVGIFNPSVSFLCVKINGCGSLLCFMKCSKKTRKVKNIHPEISETHQNSMLAFVYIDWKWEKNVQSLIKNKLLWMRMKKMSGLFPYTRCKNALNLLNYYCVIEHVAFMLWTQWSHRFRLIVLHYLIAKCVRRTKSFERWQTKAKKNQIAQTNFLVTSVGNIANFTCTKIVQFQVHFRKPIWNYIEYNRKFCTHFVLVCCAYIVLMLIPPPMPSACNHR